MYIITIIPTIVSHCLFNHSEKVNALEVFWAKHVVSVSMEYAHVKFHNCSIAFQLMPDLRTKYQYRVRRVKKNCSLRILYPFTPRTLSVYLQYVVQSH